jgi:hypothetical protein
MAYPRGGSRLSVKCGNDGFAEGYNASLGAKQAAFVRLNSWFASFEVTPYLGNVEAMDLLS